MTCCGGRDRQVLEIECVVTLLLSITVIILISHAQPTYQITCCGTGILAGSLCAVASTRQSMPMAHMATLAALSQGVFSGIVGIATIVSDTATPAKWEYTGGDRVVYRIDAVEVSVVGENSTYTKAEVNSGRNLTEFETETNKTGDGDNATITKPEDISSENTTTLRTGINKTNVNDSTKTELRVTNRTVKFAPNEDPAYCPRKGMSCYRTVSAAETCLKVSFFVAIAGLFLFFATSHLKYCGEKNERLSITTKKPDKRRLLPPPSLTSNRDVAPLLPVAMPSTSSAQVITTQL